MSSADVSLENEACATHGDRPAVGRCASCGRTVCLRCAVPVRGRVLCSSCAARAIGEAAPSVPPRSPTRIPEAVAVVLLALALVATIPPWDRFGTALSAWRPAVSGWRVAASVALVVALAAASVALWRGPLRGARRAGAGYTVLAAAASIVIAWQVVASPDYVAHTAAPYAVIGLGAAAAVVGATRLRSAR